MRENLVNSLFLKAKVKSAHFFLLSVLILPNTIILNNFCILSPKKPGIEFGAFLTQ